ncbi:hypothetical protein DVH24_001574 [Malus domestica]|uniref:RNase H type-1 domain-containing protein n=1 Tax=Malus domestica TaxID=3750 RepID=A0A498JZK9_MALDO|nr:hypothetical protein DVH24_001574 [Malus domestica]
MAAAICDFVFGFRLWHGSLVSREDMVTATSKVGSKQNRVLNMPCELKIFESDAKMIIQMLRKETPIDFSLECILGDIESLACRLTSVSFAYVSRESNLAAHSVANEEQYLSGDVGRILPNLVILSVSLFLANENSNGDGPSDSATADGDAEVTNVDDGELYIDELNELEASFSKVAIQEPGTDA